MRTDNQGQNTRKRNAGGLGGGRIWHVWLLPVLSMVVSLCAGHIHQHGLILPLTVVGQVQ
ncbi:hypothetical protein CFR74_07855 [Novacetimonas hansenii]|nr:hypothetical protein CFR74_07855 [Novacetimonas hansenii]